MNKMTTKEEIACLKIDLKILNADFQALYGELAGNKIINDKEYQKSSKEMLEWMEKEEEKVEMKHNSNMTYTNIKSDFVKNEIKKTSWKSWVGRGYIDNLMMIELFAIGKTFGLPTGHLRNHFKKKYPKQWKTIWMELNPKGYQKALQHDQKKKEKIERDERKFKKGYDEDLQKEKEAWKRAGGRT